MYKVILVDDEPWTLQGIVETFAWQRFEFEVIGSYTSAAQALEAIVLHKPDAVFTDIRMPGITGIELMNELRKRGLDTEIVIISGFSEFEYAQQAIKSGAFDYFLKPINEEMTDDLLLRLKSKLDDTKAAKARRLFEFVTQEIEPSDVDDHILGFSGQYPFYQVLISMGRQPSAFQEILKEMQDIEFVEVGMCRRNYTIVNSRRDLFPILSSKLPEGLYGVSGVSETIKDIPALVTQAAIASASSFITGKDGVYKYSLRQSQKLNAIIKRMLRILDENQFFDFQELMTTLPEFFASNKLSVEDLCYLWNQLVMHLELTVPTKMQNSEFTALEWHQFESKFDGIEDFCQALINEVRYCCSSTDETDFSADEQGKSSFSKILSYIQRNYQQQIRLKDLSQMFYINKNYACFLFQKFTGMTYTEYINKYRMDKVCELLIESALPISEVAEKAGYTDYWYFSKLFKKTFGVTPTKYRKEPAAFTRNYDKAALNREIQC